MPELLFLGTSDSQGVPRWWCRCPLCEEARQGGINRRSRPGVAILGEERVLVDAPPELRLQLAREGLTQVEALLITHAHNDHLLGLGDVAEGAYRSRHSLEVYAPAEVLSEIQHRFAYLFSERYAPRLRFFPLEETHRTLNGYRVEAFRVPHGFNGWSYAFRFEGPQGAWAYIPDAFDLDDLSPWRGLDLIVLGATLLSEAHKPRHLRSTYDVEEAIALLAELKPRSGILTHLSHEIDVRRPLPPGLAWAHDGLRLPL
jgi:phosphoribosyl 1,2-cyclic phosphate phosphodiesterase